MYRLSACSCVHIYIYIYIHVVLQRIYIYTSHICTVGALARAYIYARIHICVYGLSACSPYTLCCIGLVLYLYVTYCIPCVCVLYCLVSYCIVLYRMYCIAFVYINMCIVLVLYCICIAFILHCIFICICIGIVRLVLYSPPTYLPTYLPAYLPT